MVRVASSDGSKDDCLPSIDSQVCRVMKPVVICYNNCVESVVSSLLNNCDLVFNFNRQQNSS